MGKYKKKEERPKIGKAVDEGRIADDGYRNYLQMLVICFAIAVLAFSMSVVSFALHEPDVAAFCLIYSLCQGIDVALLFSMKKAKLFHFLILSVSTILLAVALLVTGGSSGLSPFWLFLLPAFGFTVFGKGKGIVVCAAVWSCAAFLLWTNAGNGLLQYEYSGDFRWLYPVAFAVIGVIGFLFEHVRSKAQNELVEMRNKMKEISETDALTGMKNRYWFNRKITRKFNGRTMEKDGMLLLWDIDLFKHLNDTYGHSAGDRILVRHAQKLKDVFPAGTLYCRWGGEEFLAFLPDCGYEEGIDICEKLRLALGETTIEDGQGESIGTTVSVGAVFLPKETVFHASDLFTACDRLLYRSKNNGRNCVTVAPVSETEEYGE